MKKRIIAILTIALSVSALKAQQSLSLDDFREMVVNYSNQLKMSRENISAAESKVKMVRTGYYPSLAGGASANYFTNSPMKIDMPGLDIKLKDFSYSAQMSIQQNIYTGGAVKNQTKAAKIELDIARLGEQLTLENVIYAADMTYWALAASIQQREISKHYVEIVQDLYDIVTIRFNDGYVSRTDLLMVETRLNEAKLQYLSAEKLYQNSVINLNNLIGQHQSIHYMVSDTISIPVNMPAMSTLEEALERRPDHKIAQFDVSLQNQNVKLSRTKFNPQLVGGVQGFFGTSNPNFTGQTNQYGIVYASLNVNIFNWNERRHAVSMAKAGVRAKEWALIDSENQVNQDMQNAQTNLDQSYKQAEIADQNLRIAQDNLELNTYSYSEGRLPILDVLQSQLSWIQSYTASVNSNYNYKVSLAEYQKAIGGNRIK